MSRALFASCIAACIAACLAACLAGARSIRHRKKTTLHPIAAGQSDMSNRTPVNVFSKVRRPLSSPHLSTHGDGLYLSDGCVGCEKTRDSVGRRKPRVNARGRERAVSRALVGGAA